ncbi:MAG: hypothetical protein HFJ75_03430 [Eggerthellaceae bacterium]|nr:hypothetical protein [Eggerthellaceae bacterium]
MAGVNTHTVIPLEIFDEARRRENPPSGMLLTLRLNPHNGNIVIQYQDNPAARFYLERIIDQLAVASGKLGKPADKFARLGVPIDSASGITQSKRMPETDDHNAETPQPDDDRSKDEPYVEVNQNIGGNQTEPTESQDEFQQLNAKENEREAIHITQAINNSGEIDAKDFILFFSLHNIYFIQSYVPEQGRVIR